MPVNLSPINFQNEKQAAAVSEILADYDLPPEMPMLEITEGMILNERSVAIETMKTIRRPGVGLSLERFRNRVFEPRGIHLDGRRKSNFRISATPRNPVIVSASCRISLFGSPQ